MINETQTTHGGFRKLSGIEPPPDKLFNTCVRCGLCLQSCPTYVNTNREASSPRGRIALIRAVGEDRLPLVSPGFVHQMDECLGCLACQAVCPSGVQYGHLLEAARAQTRTVKPRSLKVRTIENAVFNYLFIHPALFRIFARSMWIYQRSGVRAVVQRSGVLRLMGMENAEKLLPTMNNRFWFAEDQRFSANGNGNAARRVALLTGCVQSVAFAHVHEATIRTLRLNGCEIVVPKAQHHCCGALHAHCGDFDRARQLARKNIVALEAAHPDIIVANAAGCSHHLKEYAHLLKDDPDYADRAERFVGITRDINELLAELGPAAAPKSMPWRVTYQEPCHLAHGQKVTAQPRKILASIPGLELLEMKDSAMCCGSAGTYNLLQPDMAGRLLRQKLDNAAATGADIIASANTGCMIQLQAGLQDRKSDLRLMHTVEILDAAYRNAGMY
jgi:glycolate oxidase iron-sulfur subunit